MASALLPQIFISIINELPKTLLSMWPILLLVLGVNVMKFVKFSINQSRYRKAGLSEVDQMTGEDFELFLVDLFRKLGYRVEHTGRLGDFGSDLIIEKDGVKTVVQAKRQNSKVKESAVQSAIAAKEYYHCDKAMVVTNNYYWKHAWVVGKETKTTLWTRQDLTRAILQSRQKRM